MTIPSLAKPPEPLNLKDRTHQGENWKQFRCYWIYYERAAKIAKEEGAVRVANLHNVIDKDTQDMYKTLNLSEDDQKKIDRILKMFEARCVPVKNVIYECYIFNKRVQKPGENVDHYIMDIISWLNIVSGEVKDDLIRDKLVSGIREDKVHEKLLGIKHLTQLKAIDTLKADQAMKFRVKDMASAATEKSSTSSSAINKIGQKNKKDKDNPTKDREQKSKKPDKSPKQQHPIDRT